jgi:predicted nucleic acid-binding Zn ribbon protein
MFLKLIAGEHSMNKVNYRERANKVVCLEDEMDDFIKYYGLDDKMKELKILNVWNECVGDAIAKYSRPVEIRKDKLFVSVENSVWRYELSVRKNFILEKVNETLCDPVSNKKLKIIKEIIFI